MPTRPNPTLISATKVRACLAVELAWSGLRAPTAWATRVKAPEVTETIVIRMTMVSVVAMPTADMESTPRWPTI